MSFHVSPSVSVGSIGVACPDMALNFSSAPWVVDTWQMSFASGFGESKLPDAKGAWPLWQRPSAPSWRLGQSVSTPGSGPPVAGTPTSPYIMSL